MVSHLSAVTITTIAFGCTDFHEQTTHYQKLCIFSTCFQIVFNLNVIVSLIVITGDQFLS